MAQEFRPGEIVPQSGVYRITHDPLHSDMPHEVTVIKGRRFPTCRHCKGISFELAHAASMSPVASGWSGRRAGLAPAGKAPPCHGARGKGSFSMFGHVNALCY